MKDVRTRKNTPPSYWASLGKEQADGSIDPLLRVDADFTFAVFQRHRQCRSAIFFDPMPEGHDLGKINEKRPFTIRRGTMCKPKESAAFCKARAAAFRGPRGGACSDCAEPKEPSQRRKETAAKHRNLRLKNYGDVKLPEMPRNVF